MIKSFQLSNGMQVAVQQIKYSKLCTVGLWVSSGSRNENLNYHGISHFVEHMMFKGTKNRSALEIVSEIESVGGTINAYTGYEITAYYSTILIDYYEKPLSILADMLQNYTFNQNEFIKEKDVIIQEINESLDDPTDNIFDYLRQMCYPNQSLGRNILGTTSNINKFTTDDLKHYLSEQYDNIVLVIVGDIDPQEFYIKAEKLFSNKKNNSKKYVELSQWGGGVTFFTKDITQVHLAVSFPGLSYTDDNYYQLIALSSILGGGMSSRLFNEIREKHGLAYSVSSFIQSHFDSGMFGIYIVTNHDMLDKCSEIIGNEINKIQENITKDEINKIHAQLNTDFCMINENSYLKAKQIAKSMLYHKKCLSHSEIIEKINLIKSENIIYTAQSIFKHKPSIAILGSNNKFNLEKIEKILRIS